MESIVEKLGFFDFFNLIIVGMYTTIGCFIITYQFGWSASNEVVHYLTSKSEVNTILLVLCFSSIIAISYIIGMLCHEIYSLVDNDLTFIILITNLFQEGSCIDNQRKRKRYADIAKMVFDKNGIKYSVTKDDPPVINWNWELNNYYFTYCVYQLQVRGLNRKTEKLRDIEGLAKSFCVSNIFLLAVLLGGGLLSWNTFTLPKYVFGVEVILLLTISFIFNEYRIKALKNRVRMTISLFEAVFDKEFDKELTDSKTADENDINP